MSEVRENIIRILESEKKPLGISEIREVAEKLGLFVGANSGVTGNAMRDSETRKIRSEFRYDIRTRKYCLSGLAPTPKPKPTRTSSSISDKGMMIPNLSKFSHRVLVPNNNTNRNNTPNDPGLYFLHNSKYQVIYIGLSQSYKDSAGIRSRLQIHHNPASQNEGQRVKFSFFSYALITDELIEPLERFLIGVFNPEYNTQYRTIK